MEILCTNDDGVFSPGLAAAAEVALEFGNVTIVAPSSQKTGAGRSLIGERTKPFSKTGITAGLRTIDAYHMECTPALALRHAFSTLLTGRKIDLAISGINYGENIGYDISMSGTVGAAIECAVGGVPAMAVSLQTEITGHHAYGQTDWTAVKHFLRVFIRRFIDKGSFDGFDVLKLDVPMGASERTEWKVCRLERSPYFLAKIDGDSDGAVLADAVLYTDTAAYAPGSDAHTLAVQKKVAVTPLILDWTAREPGVFFE